MPNTFDSAEPGKAKGRFISELITGQKTSGEFETFAQTRDGKNFYIGESPFVTAHIIYLLHGIEDDRIKEIIRRAIAFLENIDFTGKRIYKYWYLNAKGTAYQFLP